MAGDEIVANYRGVVYSERVTTIYNEVHRFRSSSARLTLLALRNSSSTRSALIGSYQTSVSSFTAHSYTLKPDCTLYLKHVDIYTMGYLYIAGEAILELIGTT